MLTDSVADGHEKFLILAEMGIFFCHHVHAGLEAHWVSYPLDTGGFF